MGFAELKPGSPSVVVPPLVASVLRQQEASTDGSTPLFSQKSLSSPDAKQEEFVARCQTPHLAPQSVLTGLGGTTPSLANVATKHCKKWLLRPLCGRGSSLGTHWTRRRSHTIQISACWPSVAVVAYTLAPASSAAAAVAVAAVA